VPDQPPRPPRVVPDWARYYMNGPAPHPLASDEAQAHLAYFDSCAPEWGQKNRQAWQPAYAACMVGAVCPVGGPVSPSTLIAFRACVSTPFFPQAGPTPPAGAKRSPWVDRIAQGMVGGFVENQEEGPAGAALLAVRAARRAVAANPDDAQAYLRLYQAYGTLRFRTQERAWAPRFPMLDVLRQVQMVAALQNALEIDPEMGQAHLELSQLFLQKDPVTKQDPISRPVPYTDLALEHRTEYVNRVRITGPQPGERPDDFRDRLEKLEQGVKDLEGEVQKNEQLYLVRSSNQGRLQKALLALQMGLAKKALEVLLESDYVEFGIEGAQLELDLLLKTGRLRHLRHNLKDPEAQLSGHLELTSVGPETLPAYEWFSLLFAAAEGDYKEADQQAAEMIKQLDPTERVVRLLGDDLLETTPGKPLAVGAENRLRHEMLRQQQLADVTRLLREQMNLYALRGALALEAGDNAAARKHIATALRLSIPPDRYVPILAGLGSASPLEAAVSVPTGLQAGYGPLFDFFGRPLALRYEELFEAANP
jgi:hypothetical protein